MAAVAPGRKGRRRSGDAGLDSPPIRQIQSGRGLLRALCSAVPPMNTSSVQIKEPVPIPVATGAREVNSSPAMVSKPPGSTLFAVPLATLMALAVHGLVSKNEPSVDPHLYSVFLGLVLGVFVVGAVVQ